MIMFVFEMKMTENRYGKRVKEKLNKQQRKEKPFECIFFWTNLIIYL